MTSRKFNAPSISIDGKDLDLLRSVGARVEVELKPDYLDARGGSRRLGLLSVIADHGGKAELADIVGENPWSYLEDLLKLNQMGLVVDGNPASSWNEKKNAVDHKATVHLTVYGARVYLALESVRQNTWGRRSANTDPIQLTYAQAWLLANLPETHSVPSEESRRQSPWPSREAHWNVSRLVLNRLVTASSEVGEGPARLSKKGGLMVEFGGGQMGKPVRMRLASYPCRLAIWMNTLGAGHTLKEIAKDFGGDEAKLEKMLSALVKKGVVSRMKFNPTDLYREAYWNAVWIDNPSKDTSAHLNVAVLTKPVAKRAVRTPLE